MLLFYLLPELKGSFSRHILFLRPVRLGEGEKLFQGHSVANWSPRDSAQFLLAQSPLCCLQLCLQRRCFGNLFWSHTVEFTLNSWKCFQPTANTVSKECTHTHSSRRYLLPDDWDTSDKTRLTYFNLMAGFWHTGGKKVYKGQKPTVILNTVMFPVRKPSGCMTKYFLRTKRKIRIAILPWFQDR